MELMTIDLPEHDVLRRPAQPVSFPLNEEIKQLIAQMRQFIERLASPYGKPAGEV